MRIEKRMVHRLLAGLTGTLALAAAFVTAAVRGERHASIDVASLASEIEHETDHITARELAVWIRGAKPPAAVSKWFNR